MNMNRMKSFFRGRVGGLTLCVLEILVGVLLLIDPVGFTSGIIIGAGVLMALGGAVCMIRYFTVKPDAGAASQLLFKGLTLLMAGVLCMTQYMWFLTAFPLLTVLYAGWMLVLAAMKLQHMTDMLRIKTGRWYMPAIAAGVAVVLAVIILWNPFGAVNAVWSFAGVSLIAEAVVELVGTILK
ncbi:MAG: DUF308 domain-containing protein [Clostridia bacterium]|nr:DUF308 domain-containing protein [Clostridia bacterium]